MRSGRAARPGQRLGRRAKVPPATAPAGCGRLPLPGAAGATCERGRHDPPGPNAAQPRQEPLASRPGTEATPGPSQWRNSWPRWLQDRSHGEHTEATWTCSGATRSLCRLQAELSTATGEIASPRREKSTEGFHWKMKRMVPAAPDIDTSSIFVRNPDLFVKTHPPSFT